MDTTETETARLHENGQLAWLLQQAISQGSMGLDDVPHLVDRMIEENRWQVFIMERTQGKLARHRRFSDFVEQGVPEGLGSKVKTLWRLCHDHPDVQNKIDAVTQRKNGERGKAVSNRNSFSERPVGTTRQQALRRLRKDRPDLLARVEAGDLSAHAAMIEAGFLPRTITVRTDDVQAAARCLHRHFTAAQLAALIEELALVAADDP